MTESDDDKLASLASSLYDIVERSRPRMMRDEQVLLQRIGVSTSEYIAYLTHYLGSGRVSVLWHVNTTSQDDAMRVALVAPPDDLEKRSKVERWVSQQSGRSHRIRRELVRKGVL